MLKLKFHSIDEGFCRVYYTTGNRYGEPILYCFQDEGPVVFYRCSQDGEPNYPVEFTSELARCTQLLPVPLSELAQKVVKFIDDTARTKSEREDFIEFLERLLLNLQPPASFALGSANLEITRGLIKVKIEEIQRRGK